MDNPLVQSAPGLFFWTIVTFGLLLWALAKFAWRPLLKALEDRQETIRRSLDDADAAKQELARLQAESAQIIAEARTEAQSIITQSRVDAEKVRNDLKTKASAEAATIVKNAERQIKQETAQAIQQIRREAVELSLNVASKLIRKNLTSEDNDALIQEALEQIDSPAH